MMELKKFLPSQKERWLRKEGKKASPIPPMKLKYLLEPPRKEEIPPIIQKAHELYLKGKVIVPGAGEIPKPDVDCLKKGECEGVHEEFVSQLTRLSWLILPALKYYLSPAIDTYHLIKKDLMDWINKNPPLRGIGWQNTEDIAIRAATLPLIYEAIGKRALEDRKFTEKFIASLIAHYLYLNEVRQGKGLEKFVVLTGLMHSGVFLRKFSVPTPIFDLIMEEFLSYIFDQLDREGFYNEGSIEAHLFFFELSLFTAFLLQKNKYLFGEAWERIEKQALIISELNSREGLPRIGMERNFYLFPFWTIKANPDFLLSLFYSLRPGDKAGVPAVEEVSLFVKPASGEYKKRGLCLKKQGLATLINGSKTLVFSCLPTEEGDKLSFVLIVNGKQIISDPGTHMYSSPYREEMSSTLYHTTVSVDNMEQKSVAPKSRKRVFIMTDCTKTATRGEFRWPDGVVHSRKITKVEGGFEIEDEISDETEREISWAFIFHPDVKIKFEEKALVLLRDEIKVTLVFPSGMKIEVEPIKYSRKYGALETASRVIFRKRGRGKFTFRIE